MFESGYLSGRECVDKNILMRRESLTIQGDDVS
jgi:hypothetical protein